MTELKAIDAFLKKVAVSIENRATTDTAPVKTGRLREDIRVFPQTKSGEIEVGNTAAIYYAKWVYFGTKPYEIRPKKKKALETPYGVYKKVKHPGIKANPYLEIALVELASSGELNRLLNGFSEDLDEEIFDKITEGLTKLKRG